ncbi:MAG: 5-formyltetrahydrofolate cyclo-ligase [Tetrasphaera sp.]
MATAKQQARARRRAARRAIAATRDLHADGEAIATHLAALFDALAIGPGDDVTAYEPLPIEPDIEPVCRALAARGARVLVPITLPSYDLDWADLADPERTPLGLDAVATCPVLLIPGLSVDQAGTRLGQAGGCYDRTLPRAHPEAPIVTVLHPGELLDACLPSDSWDAPVDAVVTADGLTWLRGTPPLRRTSPASA